MKFMTWIFIAAALSACSAGELERHAYEGLQARQHALGQDGSLSGSPAPAPKTYDQYQRERKKQHNCPDCASPSQTPPASD